jgi:outer membrane protein TolC
MQADVLGEYVAGLQARYGFSVNDAALKEALGTGPREQPEYE